MVTTNFLIGLIILILLVALYFLNKKTFNITWLGRSTDSSLPIFDRIADDYLTLSPGTRVPRNGNYECIICAKGGFQDSTTAALFGPVEAESRLKAQKPTMQFFIQDSILPPCPNCGDAGGWSLLK